jgi:hypothetical protein
MPPNPGHVLVAVATDLATEVLASRCQLDHSLASGHPSKGGPLTKFRLIYRVLVFTCKLWLRLTNVPIWVMLQADLCSQRLGRAGQLTSLLADELVRWQAAATDLSSHLELLVGDVLLAAAAVNYLGPFTGWHLQQHLPSVAKCWSLQLLHGAAIRELFMSREGSWQLVARYACQHCLMPQP